MTGHELKYFWLGKLGEVYILILPAFGMRLGIFWHLLDVIWVGIFSFVYLSGVSQ